jgi:hypothetical protein
MNEGIDAVNYCRSRSLYQHQINEAQHRCNINGTVELVLWIDRDDAIIDEITLRPDPNSKIRRNIWR